MESLKRVKIRGSFYWAYRDQKGRFLGTFKAKSKRAALIKIKEWKKNVIKTVISEKTGTVSVFRYDKKKSRSAGKYQYFVEGYYKRQYIIAFSAQYDNKFPTRMAKNQAYENFYMALSGIASGKGNSTIEEGKAIFKNLRNVRDGIRFFK